MKAFLWNLTGPLIAAALLVGAGVYLGNLAAKAKKADTLAAELTASRNLNMGLVVKAAKANTARLKAEALKSELEVSLEDALKRRTAPVVVRRIAPPGTSCLGADAVRLLNDAVADSNRAVRAAANGLDDAAH